MKKLAFVLGYTGGILALVFSLLMIYLVPFSFVSKTLDDIKYEMKNENVIALNEVGIEAKSNPITDYSQSGLIRYASDVAKKSDLITDEDVYEETMAFTYKTALTGIVSLILIGISIIAALVAFIGSLVVRKASTTGAIMMLIAALVLLLSAIYTGTVIPMIAAAVILSAAGIVSFIPERQHLPQEARVRRQKPPQVKQAKAARPPKAPRHAPRPQQPYAPPYGQGYAQYPQQQYRPQQQNGRPYGQPYAPYPQQPRPQYQPPYPPQYAQGQPPYPPQQVPVQAPVHAPAQTMEIPFQQPVQAAPQSGVPFPEVEGKNINPGEEK